MQDGENPQTPHVLHLKIQNFILMFVSTKTFEENDAGKDGADTLDNTAT